MNKRSKLAALLGAGLLTFGVAGVALASTDLLAGQVGVALSTIDLGTDCATEFPDLAAGEVGVHFQLTQSADADGDLSAVFSTDTLDLANATASHPNPGAGTFELQWDGVITGDGDTTITSATTSATGNNLTLSHVCFGAAAPTPTPGGGGGGESDVPTQPATDSIGSTGNSGPTDTAWLLVVGLGVLLASIVVLTPARAKSRR
jgi:hypothetical protein